MPSRQRLRPLKAWRYVGVYGPELMLCVAAVRIGRARQAFWAVWDRSAAGCTSARRSGAAQSRSKTGRRARSSIAPCRSTSRSTRPAGIETVCPSGGALRVDAQAGWDPGARHGRDRRPAARDRGARGDRRHRRLLRAPHALALVGRGRHRRRRHRPRGLEPRQRRQRPAERQRAHRVGRRRAGRGGPVRVRRRPVSASGSSASTPRPCARATRTCCWSAAPTASRSGRSQASCRAGSELAEGYGVMEDHDVWW